MSHMLQAHLLLGHYLLHIVHVLLLLPKFIWGLPELTWGFHILVLLNVNLWVCSELLLLKFLHSLSRLLQLHRSCLVVLYQHLIQRLVLTYLYLHKLLLFLKILFLFVYFYVQLFVVLFCYFKGALFFSRIYRKI